MNIDRINVGGNLYDVCDTNARAMISDEYNSATQYNAGDYCIWENTLKKANKSTTGTYDHTAWDDTNIGEVVGELNQKMSFEIIPWNDLTLSKITLINETYGFLKSGNMVYGQCYFIANENINSYTDIISGLPEIKKTEGGILWSAPDNKPIGLALYQRSGNIQNAIALTEGQQYLLSVQGIL